MFTAFYLMQYILVSPNIYILIHPFIYLRWRSVSLLVIFFLFSYYVSYIFVNICNICVYIEYYIFLWKISCLVCYKNIYIINVLLLLIYNRKSIFNIDIKIFYTNKYEQRYIKNDVMIIILYLWCHNISKYIYPN